MIEPAPHLRILDANLNRAREALRVIEDYARFILDDAPFAARAKNLRHALRPIIARLGPQLLLAARDSESDVGREVRTTSEQSRDAPLDVARAAFGRLSEAARSIAEFGKLVGPDVTEAAERIRFQSYELQSALELRGEARRRLRAGGLYVIVTESLCRGPWLDTAAAALRGGAAMLQLREKSLTDADLLARARSLRTLTREAGALLVINDRPDIARLAGADGVHVGQDDLPVADVRRIAGPALLVGRSTHTRAQIKAAAREEPDYVAVGPMFPTTTKPQEHIAGVETLRFAAGAITAPLVAIGGIDPPRAAGIRAAGAAWICVCSAIISAPDPEAAARAVLEAIRRAAPPVTPSRPPGADDAPARE